MTGRPAIGPLSMFQRWPGRIGGLLTALACACLCAGPAWSQAALVPNAIQQFFDANGNPLSSGFVYFYVPGTTSPKTVWQDAGQTIPYANPIQLNAAGEPNNAAGIWGAGNYRQIVQDQLQNLIWDAVTSTPGTSSGGGGTSGDGMPIGFIMAYAGPTAPTGYDFAYGQSYSRSGFPTLLAALTITQNGTCTNGGTNITALSDTSQMGIGQTIESTCLPPGTTITAILSSSSVSVSAVATGLSGTYSFQVFPFGNGNGATTFQLPDLRGYGLAGRDNMGGTAANVLSSATRANGWDLLGAVGGVEALTLALAQMPSHSHEILVTDPGHAHAFTYGTTAAGSGGAAQITQIDALGDSVLTGTQVQATGITATAVSRGGGVAVSAVLGAPTSQALASGTVSFGGASYTNGASVSLTVTGGTCGTQPVVLATVSGGKVTAINSVATPGACTVPPTNPATLSDGSHTTATIVGTYGNGSGYTTGSQVLTVLGGTCTTQPQFTVTVAGGSVTTVNSLTTAGSCTAPPTNPAATSGGGGTGATLAVTYSTTKTPTVQPVVTINYVIKVNTNSGAFTVPIANNTVVGNNSGVTNPPTAITAPAVLAMICSTRGAVLESSATGWTCVAPGTNGYVWTSNGAGADPSYQPVSGAGGAVSGPASSLLNAIACWNNAFGTVLRQCSTGIISANTGVLAAPQTGTLLQVANADGVNTRVEVDAFGAVPFHSCVRADGTAASPTAVQSGDELCSLNSFGHNGTAVVGPSAAYRIYAAQNWSVGAQGTYLRLATTASSGTTMTDRLSVENDGGITVPPGVTGGSQGSGTINATQIYRAGTVLATVATSASAGDLSAGTLLAARMPALTGDVTSSAGTVATTIAGNVVTNGKLAQGAALTVKCNPTGSLANEQDCTGGVASAVWCVPSVTIETTGTAQTYTTPTCNSTLPLYLEVELVGGGGSAAGSGTGSPGAGSAGNATTFGSFTAGGGSAPSVGLGQGQAAGGAVSGCTENIVGGQGAGNSGTASVNQVGGTGGVSTLGGNGGGASSNNPGGTAAANTGSGGGAPGTAAVSSNGAASGAAGGTCRTNISSPAATYTYTVGAATSGGAGGTNGFAGGGGAAGRIKVVARWQ